MLRVVTVAAAAVAACAILPAAAQAPARKAAAVTIVNGATSPVEELLVTNPGEEAPVLARLAKPLEPGKSVVLQLKGAKGCAVALNGRHADGSAIESEGMDVCKDKTIRLTE